MNALPVYKIKGKLYFLDKRLNEYRNIKDINDRYDYDKIGLEDLEKPTEQDIIAVEEVRWTTQRIFILHTKK